MSATTESTSSAPRWRTLTALTVGVLFAHLSLLTGGWPEGLGTDPVASSGSLADTATPTRPDDPGSSPVTASAAPAVITSSRVRWIVPKPPEPPPPPEIKPPPPKPLPAPPPPLEPSPDTAEAPLPSTERPDAPLSDPVQNQSTGARMSGLDHEPTPDTPEPGTPGTATDPAATAEVGTGALPTPEPPPTEPADLPVADQVLPPAQVPPSMRLMYEVTGRVKGINYNASGSLDWENQGERYAAHMVVRALFVGSREQTSAGVLTPTGLVPERFGDKSRSERAAHFDAQNQRIRFSNNAPDAPWITGGQDRLSVFMQLASLLQAQPEAYPPGTIVSLQVAGPGDAEIWRFEMGAEETLPLPAGQMKARHIKRAPRKPFDTQTELWLAPQLNHLPVRIRITQHNGDHVEQALRYLP